MASKVTVSMLPETITAMQDAARLNGLSEADTVNRAIQFWAFIQLVKASGGSVHVRETAGGRLQEVRYGDE